MRLLKLLLLALLMAFPGLAQIPAPQINLSGNIGCQGFPCVNNGTLIMASDANRTMTALETSAMFIKVTSSVSLTATRNLIAPVGHFNFTIENATTGGQSIQIIGASGAGVTIANGTTVAAWNDGTNFVQIGSASGGATFPVTNGVVFNTSTSASRNAVFGDIVSLWSSCTSGFLQFDGTCANPSGSGTVTTTGSPASGNMAKFSGSTSITNATDGTDFLSPSTGLSSLTGDATTLAHGAAAVTVVGIEGAPVPPSAPLLSTNSSRQLVSVTTIPISAPVATAILIGNSGGTAYASEVVTGDASLTATGVLTVVKVNGASVPTSTAVLGSNSSGQIIASPTAVTTASNFTLTGAIPAAVNGTKTVTQSPWFFDDNTDGHSNQNSLWWGTPDLSTFATDFMQFAQTGIQINLADTSANNIVVSNYFHDARGGNVLGTSVIVYHEWDARGAGQDGQLYIGEMGAHTLNFFGLSGFGSVGPGDNFVMEGAMATGQRFDFFCENSCAQGMYFGDGQGSPGDPKQIYILPVAGGTSQVHLGFMGTAFGGPGAAVLAVDSASEQVVPVTSISGGGTTNYLRADGTWASPPGGSATVIQANGTSTSPVSPVNLITGVGNGGVVVSASAATIAFNLSKPFGAGTNFTTGPASSTPGDIPEFLGTDGAISDSLININDVGRLSTNQTYTGLKSLKSINFCSDTSGSGTAQSCTTAGGTFVPIAGSCIVYTTATANTGSGLTLNVNSLGAKSVSKWMGSTTTLAANDVLVGKDTWACYDGTTWELQDIGNAPSGGLTIQTNSINNSSQVLFNAQTSTANTVGLTVTPSNPSGGVEEWEITGGSYTGNAATATNLAGTFTAHQWYGNNTGSTAAPAPDLIGTNDWSPNAYVVGAGSVNVMTATLTPAATALVAGLQVDVLPNLANTTTTPTLNVNGLGAKTITKNGTSALVANDLTTTAIAEFVYDGTEWQLINPQTSSGGAVSSVSNSDGTLTISPTTGAAVASLALGHANTWTGVQTLTAGLSPILQLNEGTSGVSTCATAPFNITRAAIGTGGMGVNTGTGALFICDSNGISMLNNTSVIGTVTASGTITSNLGTAAITSATGGTGVTSVTCATAACNVSRGSYTVVGGTATTGTIVTLLWPTTTTAWVCSVDMNGGTGFLGIGHSVATATGMNITAGLTVVGVTFTVDYNCVP